MKLATFHILSLSKLFTVSSRNNILAFWKLETASIQASLIIFFCHPDRDWTNLIHFSSTAWISKLLPLSSGSNNKVKSTKLANILFKTSSNCFK